MTATLDMTVTFGMPDADGDVPFTVRFASTGLTEKAVTLFYEFGVADKQPIGQFVTVLPGPQVNGYYTSSYVMPAQRGEQWTFTGRVTSSKQGNINAPTLATAPPMTVTTP